MSLGNPSNQPTPNPNQSGWQNTSGNGTTGAGGTPSWALSPGMWGTGNTGTQSDNTSWPTGWGSGGVPTGSQPSDPTAASTASPSTAGTGNNWSTLPGTAPTGWSQTATPAANTSLGQPQQTGPGTAAAAGDSLASSWVNTPQTQWSPAGTAPGPDMAPLAPAPLSTDPWVGGMPSGGFDGTSMPTILDTNSPNYRPGGPGTPTQGQMVPLSYQFNPKNPPNSNTLQFDPSTYGFPSGTSFAPPGTSNTGFTTNSPKAMNTINNVATRHPGLAQGIWGGTTGINSLMQSLAGPNWTQDKQHAAHAAEAAAPPRERTWNINGTTYSASNPPPIGTVLPGAFSSPGVPYTFQGIPAGYNPSATPTTPPPGGTPPVVPGVNQGSGNGGNFF